MYTPLDYTLFIGVVGLTLFFMNGNPLELRPCLGAFTSGQRPSAGCCDKVREQKPCLCGYIKNPNLKQFVNSPNTLKPPAGPGGSIGALEGVSYLEVAGIVGWLLYTKSKTSSGLPYRPSGLLGAVEGPAIVLVVACDCGCVWVAVFAKWLHS
ncbi:hypothetical protein RHMOL_Rhmol10G0088900 [Rhododendron molle]|uniref:Uncharacterized protein n=1 Tax=Rhododendron molle TaxID=49168 RepID=A0ACC0M0G1_RHOML|nr:hypothetical protein RHMOL_Rhmol10G0088900 [Rhododendron molle]